MHKWCFPPKKILGVLPLEMITVVHFRINLDFVDGLNTEI